MEKIKNCPFCGSERATTLMSSREMYEPIFDDFDDTGLGDCYTVCCDIEKDGCGATSGWQINKKEALKAWNMRSSND